MHRISIFFAAAALTLALGCGAGEAPASEPIVTDTARPPGSAEPSLAHWVPEGRGVGSPHAHGPARPLGSHNGVLPPGHPPIDGHDEPADEGPGPNAISGTVRETMDAAGYTYMRLQTENGEIWVAGTQTTVAVGDRVQASGTVMQGFHSNTLDRTFDRLVLASSVRVGTAPAN